jgi:hypothetical protein
MGQGMNSRISPETFAPSAVSMQAADAQPHRENQEEET